VTDQLSLLEAFERVRSQIPAVGREETKQPGPPAPGVEAHGESPPVGTPGAADLCEFCRRKPRTSKAGFRTCGELACIIKLQELLEREEEEAREDRDPDPAA
jgi:hypothetical protein